ncbi:mannose-1-phosphate guanylyltransferase [Aliiroseovarius sp. PrR006]|uniref:mannose-1-phosphate guanylyltransferase n=1 Tax=Aliiroseovarius sp. PrR006 TaxID=2706883 RepID=UPI0013D403AD|nr:sugar phosphate nucleotidyltransferase [Aliiroseovarius sp. PrR006]NDW54612.1 mannose-1-phosphate guanylyltransferase/mannose-6-phosphate isomerase [Aliiroseovarius sp. PrR006]
MVQPVVLAGGSGTRLWPLSTPEYPKQFRPLLGDTSTFQSTLARVTSPGLYKPPITITSAAHIQIAKQQQQAVGVKGTLIAETARRDSAAAVAVAALSAQRDDPKSLVLTLAADHVVQDNQEFNATVRAGCTAAENGSVVVFGLRPSEPKTCYGYISPGVPLDGSETVFMVDRFVEKPNPQKAIEFIRDGYLWNSGNFLFRADVMVEAFRTYAPDILAAAQFALEKSSEFEPGIWELDKSSFQKAPNISIDYAIIEKLENCAVVEGRFAWSDIGAWDAVWETLPKDSDENAYVGSAHFSKSRGCFVHSESRETMVVGMTDAIIISTNDAVLVLSKNNAQDVKKIAQLLDD